MRRAKGEGALYKRKDGMWVGRYLLEGKRKHVYAKTKKAAAQKLRESMAGTVDSGMEDQQKGEEQNSEAPTTFEEFLQNWLSTLKGRVKERTFERDEQVVRLHLIPALGEMELKRLRALDLENLLSSKLESGLSPRSVQIIHATANKALKQAVSWSLLEGNPAGAVEPPRTLKKEIRTLSAEEVKLLLSAVEGEPLEALYLLAVSTGMRQGELLGLKWKDVDFERGVIEVKRTLWKGKTYSPKTAKANRSIRLTEKALFLLRGKAEASRETEWVFPSGAGTPISCHNLINRSWWPLLEKIEVERMPFHNLRHTCATLLLSQGVHPKLVQELLGHADIGTTLDTYSHVIPSLEGKTASAMEGLLETRGSQATCSSVTRDPTARLS